MSFLFAAGGRRESEGGVIERLTVDEKERLL